MHMGIFYYVINLGILLAFSFWYMQKNWTEEKFNEFTGNKTEKEES